MLNYQVLTERDFAEFLRAEVLQPLGMHDSGCDEPQLLLPGRASGYEGGAGTGPLSDGREGGDSRQPVRCHKPIDRRAHTALADARAGVGLAGTADSHADPHGRRLDVFNRR